MLSRMRTIALPRLHAAASASASGCASATGALLRPQRPLRAHGLTERDAAVTARRFATDASRSNTAASSAATTATTASSGSGSGGKGGSSKSPWPRRGAVAAAAAGVLYVVSRSEERTLPPQPAKHIRGENKALQQQQYSSAKAEAAASPSAPAPASRAAAIQAASLASALPAATAAAAVPTGHAGAEEEPSPSHPDHASCRACRDGSEETAYLQQQAAAAAGAGSAAGSSSDATASPASSSSSSPPPGVCPPCFAYSHSLCPLNRAEVGRASWGYLHTLAAYYPEHPTQRQRDEMAELIRLFMKLYPCAYCADRSVEQIEREPIQLHNASQRDLAQWMCRAHNEVNERIGKPIFDCKFVDQRSADGRVRLSAPTAPAFPQRFCCSQFVAHFTENIA